MKLLGHSDPKLTAAIYTHVDGEQLRPAVDRLPSLGGGAPLERISGSNLAMAAVVGMRAARKSMQDMERAKGFEPSTCSLGSCHSTN